MEDTIEGSSRVRSRSKSHLKNSKMNEEASIQSPVIKVEGTYLKGDRKNIAILFLLYTLQGVPLGLAAAIPLILQNKNISYKDQAEFSFVTWPFSLKLLWAPVVDSVYSTTFGRRKSWLIPTQYLIGIFLLFLSYHVDEWLGNGEDGNVPRIQLLTLMFFLCNFLAATQDIAVDGWALTMLHRRNVGHASTCNSVGQTAGFFFGYVMFIALDSADFCNTYLRSVPEPTGIITFSTFLFFWGLVFIISTTIIAIFKSDNSMSIVENDEDLNVGLKESYGLLFEVFKLSPVKLLAMVLLTSKIGFAACDAVGSLKLIQAGVAKEKLALMAVPLIPFQIFLPFIISRYIVGPRPMDVFLKVVPYRLIIGIIVALLIYATPYMITKDDIPFYYYVILLAIYGLHQMTMYTMFVACMAYYAKISDPRSGGTYMTLLNTLTNLGTAWPSTVALWFVDALTFKSVECNDKSNCPVIVDGFYVEIIFTTIFGMLWIRWASKTLRSLQNLNESAWHVHSKILPYNRE